MTAGAYLCLYLPFGQGAFISVAVLGISGGLISPNFFLSHPCNSLGWENCFLVDCEDFFSLSVLGFVLVKQVLYYLSHIPPFCFSYFSDRVSHFCLD
jgi:hypothetical protein